MKVQCKYCLPEEGIQIPDLDPSQKNNLWVLTLQSPIHSIQYIMEKFALSHRDAKYIVLHINKTYGHCNRCDYNKLDEEYMNCPKCGALNFNWKTRFQDQD